MKAALGTTRQLLGASLVAALVVMATPATAAETVKIFRSTMPDGTVVLSDKPAPGAKSVASDTFVLSAPAGAAEAERDYWRSQSEAFNRRQQLRDADERPTYRHSRHHRHDLAMYEEQQPAYYGHHVSKPIVSLHRVPRHYTSSPGAVRGRDSGFIGSGFSTSR
jgi:hypothetical protein